MKNHLHLSLNAWLVSLCLLCAPVQAQVEAGPQMEGSIYDVVIRGGRVMDPASGLDAIRDIGIRDGVIRSVSEGPHDAAFWHRLGLSGFFEHHPGYGIDGLMVWASEQNLAEVELLPEERIRYSGAYSVENQGQGAPESIQVWEEGDRLHVRLGAMGSKADQRFHLVPLGDDRFALGRYEHGRLRATDPSYEVRFIMEEDVASAVGVMESDRVLFSGQRVR